MRHHSLEKLQHRRHRPMYLAPSAVGLQQFPAAKFDDNDDSSSDNFGLDYEEDHHDTDGGGIEDLRIPLFVQIPRDRNARTPMVSPPSSNGSDANATLRSSSSSIPQAQAQAQPHHWAFQPPPTQQRRPYESSTQQLRQHESPSSSSFSSTRLFKAITSMYYMISDFLLLVFMCVIGLFFHVEVRVVKHRSRGRRGRVIIQNDMHTSSLPQKKERRYHSSDLLRPLPPESAQRPLLMGDDMV